MDTMEAKERLLMKHFIYTVILFALIAFYIILTGKFQEIEHNQKRLGDIENVEIL